MRSCIVADVPTINNASVGDADVYPHLLARTVRGKRS
jgi:hypothetical protein